MPVCGALRRAQTNRGYAPQRLLAGQGEEGHQAGALIQAFGTLKRASDLGFAWLEAWERGPRWRRRVGVGALRLSDESFAILSKGVAEAAKLDGKPADGYGLENGKDGLLARIGKRTAA